MPFSHNQALMPSVSEGLLRFWDSMKIKMRGEFMGITLILLDENYCKEQISRISGSSNGACKLIELTMILCRLFTYPHLQGLRHPTTTMSLFPCEASMAASQDFKPINLFPLQAFLAHLHVSPTSSQQQY
ncbi:hypothetical protein F2Q69_00026867 [Brassica cretica]|uniref:Uncharacterized protein n=1 Tax=Brassica cretica TaxID=69181 RepID=A0A8S9RX44_BRACR|nr:hypothetical protein F2Q69_00026867 [Brassica cretica]